VVATATGILLGAWLLIMGTLILLVMYARHRKGATQPSSTRRSSRATPKE